MNKLTLFFTVFFFAAPVWAEEPERTIDIDIIGVEAGKGQLMIGICTKQQFLSPACEISEVFPATNDWKQRVSVNAPHTGEYAIQVAYDRNGDNELSSNRYGAPTEPVGFSNNPKTYMRAPKFSEVAVDLKDVTAPISIKLK